MSVYSSFIFSTILYGAILMALWRWVTHYRIVADLNMMKVSLLLVVSRSWINDCMEVVVKLPVAKFIASYIYSYKHLEDWFNNWHLFPNPRELRKVRFTLLTCVTLELLLWKTSTQSVIYDSITTISNKETLL